MKAVNVNNVLKILYKYGKYIFVTDEKRYSDMVDEISNLKALEQEPILEKDGTLIVTTEHYENVGRVLVQYGTNGALFYQDQEPKTGHWIDDEFGSKCSCCGIHTHLDKFDRPMKFKHCSMCGAKMAEPQERTNKDGKV